MDCIVTQGAGACSREATIRPGDLATQPHDTADLRVEACGSARAHGLAMG